MSAASSSSRAVAAEIVGKWLRTGVFPDRLIAAGTKDRAFVMEVVYGVARWRRTLEWVLASLARKGADERALPYLLVGLYQVFVMDSVADYAAVNETVEAAKTGATVFTKGHGKAITGFINGVLNQAVRRQIQIRADLLLQDLGVRTSHPDTLIQRWQGKYGLARTEAICGWNNRRPEAVARVATRRISADSLRERLRVAGIEAAAHLADPQFLVLPHGSRVPSLPGYTDGLFSVQDPSTRLAVDLLDPQPGSLVLDACAAPGGKTILLAEKLSGAGSILALDMYEDRLAMLRDNVARMGLECVTTLRGNAAVAEDLRRVVEDMRFDGILLDVPCTNTGVLARRPDARWRFAENRLVPLARAQRALLDNGAAFLAPGGTIVYSTCSIEPEENELLVGSWLEQHPDFTLSESIAVLPGEHRTDGAYAAALRHSG